MIYTVKNKNEELIAFSDKFQFIFYYLKSKYDSSDKKIFFEVTRVIDEGEIDEITLTHESCELVEIYPEIVVTLWEYPIIEGFIKEFYETGKNKILDDAIDKLKIHNKVPKWEVIDEFLRKKYKSKYYNIISYRNFLNSLDKDTILDLIGSSDTNRYVYELNEEYKRKINDDN